MKRYVLQVLHDGKVIKTRSFVTRKDRDGALLVAYRLFHYRGADIDVRLRDPDGYEARS